MSTAAFAFVKTLVQTRAKGHTATGAVCYRLGLAATSSLETPIREWPSEEETRVFEQAEDRRLAEMKMKGKKAQRRRLRPKLLRMDPPRHHDYRGRLGIAVSGVALPEGATPEWGNPLEWARRVEAADGKRLDSRQCRDDVVGIPLELVESSIADLAIARQAAKLAELHRTPVHWVIHEPHGEGLNWHAHILYAGRRLSPDGRAFERRRDTAQDKPELIESHKQLWVETCREFGVAIEFQLPGHELDVEVREEFTAEHGRAPTDDDEAAIQVEKRERWQKHRAAAMPQHALTSNVLRTERDAVAEEEGFRIDSIIQAAGGAPLTGHDRRELGRISSRVEDLDTRQLLALDRIPVTTSARIAKYGLPVPAPTPSSQIGPSLPRAAPAVQATPVPARALPQPQPMATAVPVALPQPAPVTEAVLASPDPLQSPMPTPRPTHPVEPPRPRAAPTVEAPTVPTQALPQPQPTAAVAMTPPRPAPVTEAVLPPPDLSQLPVSTPARAHPTEPPHPRAALAIEPPTVPAQALPQPQPTAAVAMAPPRPAPLTEAVLAPPDPLQLPMPTPRPVHRAEPPRPRAAPAVEAPPVPGHAFPQPRPKIAAPAILSTRLLSRAGLRRRLPLAEPHVMRPPQPAPRPEEILAAPEQDQRPVAATEMIHPAPEPPWHRRLRRLVHRWRQAVTAWWPWAPAPPRPDRRVKARPPKHLRRRARPVPARWRRLPAPEGLARPTPRKPSVLVQPRDSHDFNRVNRTVTHNVRARTRETPARAGLQPHRRPPSVASSLSAPVRRPDRRPEPKQPGGSNDGIGF